MIGLTQICYIRYQYTGSHFICRLILIRLLFICHINPSKLYSWFNCLLLSSSIICINFSLSTNSKKEGFVLLDKKLNSNINNNKLYQMSKLEQKIAVDYYKILGVPKNATIQQICSHYRQLALANHPWLQHANPNAAYQRFAEAAQAFDVLHDVEKKKIYDQHGEQKLKQGVLQDGNLIGKYKFTSDPQEIFEKFFGTKNVFQHLLDAATPGQSHPIFKAQYPVTNESYKVANLVVPVHCYFTELYNGCTKQLVYDKKVLTQDGKNAEFVKQKKTIVIKPGSSSKTPIVYPEQGNSQPGYKQSMLIFNIIELTQKNYKREGDNLIYTAKISLIDALESKSVTIKELNGELVQLHFDQIISPQTRRVIGGKGMPVYGKPEQKGDLIVKFDIEFPEQISLQKKKRIVELLKVHQ